MKDYSELKKLAEAATPGPWAYDGSYVCPARTEDGTTYVELWRSIADCHQPENTKFIAAANPAAVLVLLDDLESAQKKIDQAWNRSTPALDGYIPGAMDAWKRPVKQHLPYDFSGNPGASATQYCNGWNDSGGYWKNHCLDLQSQIAGLKTGYEAYGQVNAGLKDDVEGLRKDAERYRWLRKEAVMFHVSCEGSNNKDAYLSVTGWGDDDSSEIIDNAVDFEIKKQ